jgi:hypothetical protein
MPDSKSVALRGLLDLLARNRPSERDQAQGEETGTATAQIREDKGPPPRHVGSIASHRMTELGREDCSFDYCLRLGCS